MLMKYLKVAERLLRFPMVFGLVFLVAGLAFISVITVSVATMFLNRLEYDLLQKKVAPKRKGATD